MRIQFIAVMIVGHISVVVIALFFVYIIVMAYYLEIIIIQKKEILLEMLIMIMKSTMVKVISVLSNWKYFKYYLIIGKTFILILPNNI